MNLVLELRESGAIKEEAEEGSRGRGVQAHSGGSREPGEQGRARVRLCFRKGCGRLGHWGQDGRPRPGRWGDRKGDELERDSGGKVGRMWGPTGCEGRAGRGERCTDLWLRMVPGQGTTAACGSRRRWEECLSPPGKVRKRMS